jgi:hypothetical protein
MNFSNINIVSVPFVIAILLGFLAMQGPTQALLADELKNVSDFKQCRSIKGKSERLLCYDTIADGDIFNKEVLKQVKAETFGSKTTEMENSLDELTVTIVRVKKDQNRIHYFQTSEGQVWKQVNRENWSSKVPFEANIKSGTLGSFFLVNEGGKSTRVKRVR